MAKKRLLVLTSTFPRFTGDTTPAFVYELSRRLTKFFCVYVLAPHDYGAKHHEEQSGVHICRFQYMWPASWQRLCYGGGIMPRLIQNKTLILQIIPFLCSELIATIRMIKKERIQLIHAHWLFPQGLLAAIIRRIYNIPYVVTVHGGDMQILRFTVLLPVLQFIINNAHAVTVVNNDMKTKLIRHLGTKPDIRVIPMGVDTRIFHPGAFDPTLKKTYGILDPFLLFVGSLVEKKGVNYILLAMPKILARHPSTKLMLIGDGEDSRTLHALANTLGIEKNVLFLRAIPNNKLPSYYATADLFISPSIITDSGDQEGLPVTYLEAIASGLFVITTDLPGNKDVITTDVNGAFVRQKNSSYLAQVVNRYIGSREACNKKRIRNSIQKTFSWDNICQKYITLIERI